MAECIPETKVYMEVQIKKNNMRISGWLVKKYKTKQKAQMEAATEYKNFLY